MITRLDAVTIGQIAAGEVIERPVSVVKELVENALDAGATRIRVAIENGGLDLIEVADDGSGIAPEELPLAVERHATSKLRTAEELAALATLGFRGEGLASIAAVATVRVVSRRADAEIAATIDAFAERATAVGYAAAPVGTRVEVRDLFANVPVRREFLRSPQAETTRITNFLHVLSLGYPATAFSFFADGREVIMLPATQQPLERLAHVFGRDMPDRLLAIGDVATGMHGRVRGFISRPGFERGDRSRQILFVNGRLLKSTQLTGAWAAGYAGYTTTGRYPFGVLLLELPPEHVDPNVHPTKFDVRFRFAAQVGDAVKRAIVTTLGRDARERLGAAISPAPPDDENIFNREPDAVREPDAAEYEAAPAPDSGTVIGTGPREFADEARIGSIHQSPSWQSTRRVTAAEHAFAPRLIEAETPRLRVLAQLDRAFILATDGRAVILVDQHAAHERVAYEAIAASALDRIAVQPMLVPEIFELSVADARMLESALDSLAAAGVEIEPFGERAYRLCAMPAVLAERKFHIHGFLADLDDEIPDLDARERVWATMACHSVVRAGEAMEPAEMQRIVDRLSACVNPMHCPHGRPTIVRLDAPAIARLFRR